MYGIITRRNALLMLLSVELLLNAANLSFVAYARYRGDLAGQAFVFFTMVIAACEVAIGLAVAILLYRSRETLNTDEIHSLKW